MQLKKRKLNLNLKALVKNNSYKNNAILKLNNK